MIQDKIISVEKETLKTLAIFGLQNHNLSLKKYIAKILDDKAQQIRKKQIS